MSLDNIVIVSTAVVAGIIGAVSLYLFENIRNNQHSQRTDRKFQYHFLIVDTWDIVCLFVILFVGRIIIHP